MNFSKARFRKGGVGARFLILLFAPLALCQISTTEWMARVGHGVKKRAVSTRISCEVAYAPSSRVLEGAKRLASQLATALPFYHNPRCVQRVDWSGLVIGWGTSRVLLAAGWEWRFRFLLPCNPYRTEVAS